MSETEKAQVAQIRIARGRVKASMTRLESSFDELTTKNEISIRLSRLDGLFKEFERLDSTLSLEESELEEFEERYFNLSAKFNDKLDELNVLNLSGTQNSVASSITSNSNVSNFRLPKLSIPQFSGNFKDWINFKDLFVSTVHSQISLPNIEKFQYLKGLLTNEPASLIKHIPLSNDSYEEAWQKLLDRYDNKKQIVQSLIKIFLDQKPIFEANSLNLRKLLDTSDECLRGLNALGEQASSKDCWLIYLLLQKIDPESKRLWAVKSSEEEFPNMKVFLDFLNVRCSSLELMSNDESECKPPIRKFLDVKDLDYLKSITLSDEDFMRPKECDIILGSDCFFEILRSGKIVGSKNEPIAQRTMFGWVVAGKLNVQNKEPNELYSHFLSTENDLKTDSLLQRFWETEELSVKKQFLSDEELFCEDHFQSTFKYNDQASAPYLATRCLFQVGLELERDNPTVSSLIKESFYIDDLMAGATSSEEAITSIKTLSQVLEARGFHLRKWRSNSPDVLSRISSNWVGNTSNLEIHPDECSKALGLTWNSVKDTFIFNLKVNFPDNITKRSFLSQSARLFDPLGFLTPCTVYIKIFYQQLWLLKLDWDSPLPDALATKWKTFRKEFEQICSIHIPRWIHTVSQQVTLHGFCDASELAYASVIYAVQPQADDTSQTVKLELAR
ncbi:DUF1758 domain-containing protein [Trichonephila clavata]|uniref:DUF1758 domain-containing protein n=1 Tax=Trichonephila clavata TaxID=2740835 RepID=A0A8X6G8E9_TRICU|nr:DUF1758 domain-containing protein [Trichonephila clavata]